MYRLGWFSTGRGRGSRGLLKAVAECIRSGELKAKIVFVFCSREHGETEATDIFLKMVEDYGTPLVTFSYRKFKAQRGVPDTEESEGLPEWRLEYDREVMRRLSLFRSDLCVLAGYMLIVGPELCQKYDMINLHPAAPGGPSGTWQEVIWNLIDSNASYSGVMMHLVTPELDKGPVVTYCTFPIKGSPFDNYWAEIEGRPLEEIRRTQGENNTLFRLIREHGYAREIPLLIATIKAFSAGRVGITPDKRVIDSAGRPVSGYDLTQEIDRAVRDSLPK